MASTTGVPSKRPRPGAIFREFMETLWYLRAMIAGLFVLFIVLTVLMYYYGDPVETSNRTPAKLSETIYFCFITALTIGFGDVVPSSNLGRIDAAALGLIGLLTGGLVVAAAVRAVQEAARKAEEAE